MYSGNFSELGRWFKQLADYITKTYQAWQKWAQSLPDEEAICFVLSIGRGKTAKNLLGNKRYDRLVSRVKQLERR